MRQRAWHVFGNTITLIVYLLEQDSSVQSAHKVRNYSSVSQRSKSQPRRTNRPSRPIAGSTGHDQPEGRTEKAGAFPVHLRTDWKPVKTCLDPPPKPLPREDG